MKVRARLIVGVMAILALALPGTAVSAPRCEKVNAHVSELVDYSADPACTEAGWVACVKARVIGTINGSWVEYDPGFGFELPSFGDTSVWRGESIFETKHGEIFTISAGINFWPTYATAGDYFNLEIHAVTGGTGRYEEATGYILLDLAFLAGVGEATGEICWPDE